MFLGFEGFLYFWGGGVLLLCILKNDYAGMHLSLLITECAHFRENRLSNQNSKTDDRKPIQVHLRPSTGFLEAVLEF